MKSITIQGQKRETLGKASTAHLRKAEKVPCVVYGGNEPISFSTLEKSFKNLVYTPEAHTVVLEVEGESAPISAILQDIQFHPVTDKILHADFYQLFEDKPITMDIPVRLEGRSKGVMAGGSLRFSMRKLTVRTLPGKLPDEIVINIEKLKIGDRISITDLKNEDYSFMHPENAVVVAVKMSRTARLEGDAEQEESAEESAEENKAE